MAFKQYTLLITGGAAAVRLSDVYGTVGVVNPANDIPYRQVVLQAHPANGTPVYVGDSDLTTPDNAAFVLQSGAGNLATMTLGPFPTGAVKLSDLWVAGAGGGNPRVLVSGVPF
jgi:hypothetical protein